MGRINGNFINQKVLIGPDPSILAASKISSGLLINGTADKIVPPEDVESLAQKLKLQKGITITHETIDGANHFFEPGIEQMIGKVDAYVRQRMTENSR